MEPVRSIRSLRAAAAACLLGLAACAPEGFPEDPLFSDTRDLEAPRIDPIEPILEDGIAPARTEDAREEMLERGESLRARADDLRVRDG